MAVKKSVLPAAAAAVILTFLVVLATLQYRWIGQVSQAERERLQAGLRASATRLSQDFNEEITRAVGSLQIGPPILHGDDLEEYAERYARWSESAPYRALVRSFYLTRGAEPDVELLIVNPATNGFVPVEWPAHLANLRARLRASRAADGRRGPASAGPLRPGLPPTISASGETLLVAVPRPEISRPPLAPAPEWTGPPRPRIAGWTITEFDLRYLQTEFLPELVERHFGALSVLDYDLQVVAGSHPQESDPQKVIYRSAPTVDGSAFRSPDAAVGLLKIGPPPPQAWNRPAPMAGLPPGESGWNGPPAFPRNFDGGDAGIWQLLARHRSGSLEAAVAGTRRRNLAINFAMMLVTAAAIGVLVLSARRAERLARLQLEFVAGVSHELRTPLAVICSAGENLADGLVAAGPQVQRYGAVIRKEGRRLAEMVERTLAFAGSQAGRMNLHPRPLDIPALLERVLLASEPARREAGCEIEIDIRPDLPPVIADAAVLTRCLDNLLGNAWKYGKGGGWVRVSAWSESARNGQAALGDESLKDEVLIRIEDRGPGIAAADLPHIFEPFYRGREVVAAQVAGAGLGLCLVKRWIEAHGGSVEARSTRGSGSAFTLRLPAAARPVENPVLCP